MDKRPVMICLALAVLHTHAWAQFTDPQTYQNTPVGINQLELGYAYVRANTSIDTSVVVSGAKFNLNQGLIDYTRYFAFLHRTAWVEASIPVANLSGSITGTGITGSTTGAGDSAYTAAILLKGGPALSPEQFAEAETTTSIGLSLSTTAPTGQYNPNKLLNLGSDRWSFKPELAISKPFGSEQCSTPTPTAISTQTIPRIVAQKSCDNERSLALRDTSVTASTTPYRPLSTPGTPFEAAPLSAASIRTIRSETLS
jgi:hypothetical protein